MISRRGTRPGAHRAHRARRGRRPHLRPGEWGVLPLALGLLFFPPARTDHLPAPIRVNVDGSVRLMPPESSVGDLLRSHGLGPRDGDLLDVDGQLLVEGAHHGHVLVNGRRAPARRLLAADDRIVTVDGRDRVERTKREVVEIPADAPANPQFFLGSAPGKQIILSGRRSGKVVSVTFRPTGPSEQPRQVALTFDDGPHPVFTPQILDILERMDVPATFFVVGELAERHPKVVRRQRRMGMTVGSHSMHHPYRPPFRKLPARVMAAEIRQASGVLEELGVTPKAFRPPGGSWSPAVLEEARSLDQRLVLWSVDSRDWVGLDARRIVRGVLRDVRPGSIVLLHDGGGDRSATVAALPRIIRGLRDRDLRPVAI